MKILKEMKHRGEAALRKHLREHDQKAALSPDLKKVETASNFHKLEA